MEILWFCLVAAMLAAYVILDGFDLGVGIVHFGVARTDDERRVSLGAIGPFWDGNEVWLLAAGGAIFCAFPALYASSFSGFYLPLMMVLWLLMLRGMAIEFRSHIDNPVWRQLWDAVFMGASSLLAIFFGAALGNVVRGVPLGANGEFFLPLWTHFRVAGEVGILDWYTVSVGALAYLTLTQHGALWLAAKTHNPLQGRGSRIAGIAWWAIALLTLWTTGATFSIQPQVGLNFQIHLWGVLFPALAVAGLCGVYFFRRRDEYMKAFLASSVYIAGMLMSAAFGLFPYMLPSNGDRSLGLTIYNSGAGQYGLAAGLWWLIPGMALATGYFVLLFRKFAGRVSVESAGH